MSGWSQTTVVGFVARSPEMRYTAGGKAVCSFSVPVSRKRNGDETTQWYRVSCWDALAETVNQHVQKGSFVTVVGTLELREYKGNDGEQKASLELTAQTVQFSGGQRANGAQATASEGGDDNQIPF